MTAFEGSCGLVHEASCHILVCGGSKTQTMMQGYASAASSEAADPFFFPAVEPWGVSGTPPPRTVIGDPSQACGQGAETVGCSLIASFLQCAGRRITPSGTTPSLTKCAKATIIFLREPRAFAVRASNHLASALSFW